MVRVFYWPFSVSSIIVISSVIGYFGVSDADVVLREDEPSPNKRQQHLRRQLQLHPLRHYNKDEGSVRDNESETETDHGPTDAWLDDSMWQQIVIRALANPTEWVQLRQALDKVDADLRALTSQENASHNHSKSAPKWKFTYHRVTNPELSSSSSSSNNLKNLHYKAKAIAAVLAVSPPSSSSSSFYSNNVQDKDINRIVSTTTTISTPKTTLTTTTTTPSTSTSPEISNFDSEPKLSIMGNTNLPVPHYYLHHHRNQNYLNSRNSENDLETPARDRNHKIKFPSNHSSSSSPISTVGRTQLETEVLMMSSFSNDDRKENGRRVHRTKHDPMHIPSHYNSRPAWIQHPNPNYIPYSTMHDEPSPSSSLLGHKNKNILKSSPSSSSSSSSSSSEFFIHSAAQAQPKKIVENRRRHNDDFSEEDEDDEEQDKFHNAVVHQLHSNTENEQEEMIKKEKEKGEEEYPGMKTIGSNFPWTSNVAVEKESSRSNSNPSSSSSNSNSGHSTYNSHSYHHRRHQPRRTSGHHHSHHHHQHQHYHQVR